MMRFPALALLVVPAFSVLTGQDLVDYINENGLFEAEYHPPDHARHYGYIPDPLRELATKKRTRDHYDLTLPIPEYFDSARNWPECADVINNIRDQSNCGSCWAVAAAGVISDRICIATKGEYNVSISGIATASCAGYDGCNGGTAGVAFSEFINSGLPTGSEVDKHEGCQPYPLKHCAHHTNSTVYPPCPSIPEGHAKTCLHECQADYPRKYKEDLFFGKDESSLQDVETIQREIIANGPVFAAFQVCPSFELYKGGIYRSAPEEAAISGHAVRIVGWGIENGTKYWKIANSWNDGWGENGFFRMIRGIDDGGIDSRGFAVSIDTDHLPKPERLTKFH